jgi:hypothetical protein
MECIIIDLLHDVERHIQQYFSYIMAVSFIGGGNWSTQRKPPTWRKSLNFHFNLDSDTDPNYIHDIHEGTIHYIGTCSEETNGKKFVTFCLSFLSNFAICHSEIMHDAKC